MKAMYSSEALPAPVDHRRHAGVREAPGLPVSCVHDGSALLSEAALREALLQRICGHFEAAFKLLPVAEHPELLECLKFGAGLGLGLLEPVSNIVAYAVMDHRWMRKCIVHRRRFRRDPDPVAEAEAAAEAAVAASKGGDTTRWLDLARRSVESLVFFLGDHYFRHLSTSQALMYLYLADADLVVAMGLVETDLANASGSRSHFTFHAPCTERTGNSMCSAALATTMQKPPQAEDFVHRRFDAAMAARFQPGLGKNPVTAGPAGSLRELFHFLTGEPEEEKKDYYDDDEDEALAAAKEEAERRRPKVTVCDLRRRKYGIDRIVLSPPLTGVRAPRPVEGKEEPYCAYEETLRNILLDAMHICYLQAFARLADPGVVAAMHIPIVRSGFCFGPLDDPVDNILVNAVWFKTAYPSQCPPAYGDRLIYDERLAILAARSLDAAVAYLCARFPDTLSRHDATLLLYRAGGGCHVSRASELAELAGHAPRNDDGADVAIRAAVKATGGDGEEAHRMANFVHVLSLEAKARILARLRQPRPLGIGDLDDIAGAFALDFYFPLDDGLLPDEKPAHHVLSTEAQTLLNSKAALYEDQQKSVITKLHAMLNNEKEIGEERFFHINFLARDVNGAHWDLFFAQILRIYGTPYGDRYRTLLRKLRPNSAADSFFLPLLWSEKLDTPMSRIQGPDLLALAMSAGRCLDCQHNRAKIFHPNYGQPYLGYGCFVHLVLDGQNNDDENILESDYVYFNDQRDIRLIERLNCMVHEMPFALD